MDQDSETRLRQLEDAIEAWLAKDPAVPPGPFLEANAPLRDLLQPMLAQSLDAVSASLNEANRWMRDQGDIFAGLDHFTDEPPPADLLASKRAARRSKVSE